MEEACRAEGGLKTIPPYIEDTGEVNWLIGDATRMEVAVPVLAVSVMRLFASRDDKGYAARSIAMMRHGFGGHPYGHNDAIVHERREGRVGGLYPGPALVLAATGVAARSQTT
jgi:6-phosphogluconate dehydrogenase